MHLTDSDLLDSSMSPTHSATFVQGIMARTKKTGVLVSETAPRRVPRSEVSNNPPEEKADSQEEVEKGPQEESSSESTESKESVDVSVEGEETEQVDEAEEAEEEGEGAEAEVVPEPPKKKGEKFSDPQECKLEISTTKNGRISTE